jgi:single-strand DNA-binding protein
MPTVPKYRNECHIHGTLAADPIVRRTPSGKVVCTLNILTKFEQFSEFHKAVFWESLGERAAALRSGDWVRVCGRLQTSSWADKASGQKKYRTEIVAWQLSVEKEPITPDYNRPHGGKEAAQAVLKPAQLNAHGVEIDDSEIPF